MNTYLLLKTLHILSATLLFGTGLGSAYYLWRAHLSRHVATIALTARHVVFADWVFTTTTIIAQPLTGFLMVWYAGYSLTYLWIWLTLVLYAVAGVCWLPVVWIQIRVQRLVTIAWQNETELPREYYRLMMWWFCLGIPAFFSMVIVFFLMVFKPT
ncbi:putative integral membrane protein [Beggiatoa alba B18LD]|uniref:Putative integral membrane protein n=1 Tax=Beggiatoa alba B18LD TaxID=395493 RepID=I3CJB1_9GAMM|nr:DUF2269 domain-containing protein [Beggiatoa alba]EIJ43704.1 putative integral membrane protein [Beggiatoa alba B18LD]